MECKTKKQRISTRNAAFRTPFNISNTSRKSYNNDITTESLSSPNTTQKTFFKSYCALLTQIVLMGEHASEILKTFPTESISSTTSYVEYTGNHYLTSPYDEYFELTQTGNDHLRESLVEHNWL